MRHVKIVVVNIVIIALCINIDNVHMIEIRPKFNLSMHAILIYIVTLYLIL